jgi:hypothetical protein
MAAASFWDVFELKTNVFRCLREDTCDADLARCARVHSTWADLALNALWYGVPETECKNNQTRTKAIALLPRDRRQNYASRVGVLDFTDFGGILVHAMFNQLAFPRLKEVILCNVDHGVLTEFKHYRLSKYLQPTLRSLKLIDRTDGDIEDQTNWLTVSFLNEVVQRCPDLQEVFFWVPYTPVTPADLARFFQSIRPRAVSLEFAWGRQMITCEVLSALSHGCCLESLAFDSEIDDREAIEVDQLQQFLSITSKPFACLNRLDLYLEAAAVPLIPQCFPAVTWLRLEILSYLRDESTLKPIGEMSQLQFLEIVGEGDKSEHQYNIPARAFIALGSLTRLKSLEIGKSFFPHCVSEDDIEELAYSYSDDRLTRADASDMFAGLTALEHLSVFIDDHDSPDHLFDSVAEHCPYLSSIELVGELDPWDLILPDAPVLRNVRHMTLGDIKRTVASSQAARIIDNFAPKLEKLSFKNKDPRSKKIYAAWAKFLSTQKFFKHRNDSPIKELLLGRTF